MQLRQFIAVLLLLAVTTTGALAHAGLIGTNPADGSVIAAEPDGMTLTFTEPVSPISLSIVGLDGVPTPLTVDRQDGPLVHVLLPPHLARGSYLFSWRVTSEDGHPVNGTVGFAIGAASGSIVAAPADPALVAAIWAVRTLQYFALFFGVGGAAFGALYALPGVARRLSRSLALMGLVLVIPAMALQGLDLLGLPLTDALAAPAWSQAIGSPYAATQALLATAFVLALLPGRIAAVAAGIVGALAPTLSGHASTAEPQLLMRAAGLIHMASLMYWLGALLPLFFVLQGGGDLALRRFSRIIPWVIAALLLSGTTLALVQLGPPRDDWLSAYGLLLGAKLTLVLALLLVALWNRVRLTAHARAGETQPLRRSIVVELVLVVAILGVVAGWRFTAPPRVLAIVEAAAAPATVVVGTPDGRTANVVVKPAHFGIVSLEIGLPIAAEEVSVLFENPGEDIATIGRKATSEGGNHWRVDDLLLPAAGDWSIAVDVRTSKFDIATFTGMLSLPAKDSTMTPTKVAAAVASSMLLATPAPAAGVLSACPPNQSFSVGAITVSGAYARATPPGAQSAGAYLSITNSGTSPDTLVSVSTPAATDAMLHAMSMNGNVMQMTPMPDGLEIPAGSTASLDPMHSHLMMTGMSEPFVKGECLEMTLHFTQAGDLPVQFNVGGFAQSEPVAPAPAAGSPMEMSDPGMSAMDMGSMSSMPAM